MYKKRNILSLHISLCIHIFVIAAMNLICEKVHFSIFLSLPQSTKLVHTLWLLDDNLNRGERGKNTKTISTECRMCERTLSLTYWVIKYRAKSINIHKRTYPAAGVERFACVKFKAVELSNIEATRSSPSRSGQLLIKYFFIISSEVNSFQCYAFEAFLESSN